MLKFTYVFWIRLLCQPRCTNSFIDLQYLERNRRFLIFYKFSIYNVFATPVTFRFGPSRPVISSFQSCWLSGSPIDIWGEIKIFRIKCYYPLHVVVLGSWAMLGESNYSWRLPSYMGRNIFWNNVITHRMLSLWVHGQY